MRIKPDMYDFSKETNVQDNNCNICIRPLYCRSRKFSQARNMVVEQVDWAKRKETFQLAYFSMIWSAHEKARKIRQNSN
jgi:hypothetical protein